MTARQTARRSRVVIGVVVFGALALAVMGAAGCRQDDAAPTGSSGPMSEPVNSEPMTSEALTSDVLTSDVLTSDVLTSDLATSEPVTSPGATSAGSTPATIGLVTIDPVTTVGDLLTEAEVAEVERVLDDLDALLGEIDADLAGVPDP